MSGIDRRRFLSGTALGTVGAVATVSGAAAFSVEPASPDMQARYLDACGRNRYHDKMIAEIHARLDGKVSVAEIEETVASLRCPLCGCSAA